MSDTKRTLADAALTSVIAIGIFAINLAVVQPLFSGGYTIYMGSIGRPS